MSAFTRTERVASVAIHITSSPTTQHYGVPVILQVEHALTDANGQRVGSAENQPRPATRADITPDVLAQMQQAVAYLGLSIARQGAAA